MPVLASSPGPKHAECADPAAPGDGGARGAASGRACESFALVPGVHDIAVVSGPGRIEHVVAAVDFSAPAAVAARVAVRIASAHDAVVSLVHVEGPFGSGYPGSAALIPRDILDRVERSTIEHNQNRLEALRRELQGRAKNPPMVPVSLIGAPTEAICTYAEDERADLAVVGGRGRSAVRAWLLGSVAHRLSITAPCPVLVVRGGDERRFDGTFHRIVVGVDYSSFSRPLVEAAASLLARGGLLELVHVAVAPRGSSRGDDEIEAVFARASRAVLQAESERLSGFSDKLELGRPHVALDVEIGGAADLLLKHAHKMHADLIAVGAHRRTHLAEKLLGTVADRVLRHAEVPVLVLPGPAVARQSVGSERPETASATA